MSTPAYLAMLWIKEQRDQVKKLDPLFDALGENLDLEKRKAALESQIEEAAKKLDETQQAAQVVRTQSVNLLDEAKSKNALADEALARAQHIQKDAETKAAQALDNAQKAKAGLEQEVAGLLRKRDSIQEEISGILGKFQPTKT